MKRTALLLASAVGAIITTPALAQTTVIHAGRLITDPAQGLGGPATITVTDGVITSVAAGHQPAPAGATLIDQSQRTVMPGLIDLHVHLTGDPGGDFRNEAVDPDEWGVIMGVKNAALTVKAGFTTVREAGSAPNTGFVLRRGTEQGLIVGPRIIAAGPALSIVGGHGDVTGFREDVHSVLDSGFTCTGQVECAEKVRKASRAGSDVIKITATGGVLSQQARGLGAHFSHEEMKSIADTAHSLGLKVMAHAHGARGAEAASAAGIDTIDHGTLADAQTIKVMKANGTYLVPTLMALEGIRARLGKGIYTRVVEDKVRMVVDYAGTAVRLAKQQGVAVAFGTDAGVFEHGRNGGEFALLVKNGLTPTEAVASATTVAAKALGMESTLGKVAVGYSGDLIAVDGNPLQDVRTLENVRWVMVRGRAVQ